MLAKLRLHSFTAFPRLSVRLLGIVLTLSIALAGFALSMLPGLDRIGPLACALLLAILYRSRLGYPARLASGIRFSSSTLLRLAIVLFGLKLNFGALLQQGAPLMLRSGGTALFSLAAVLLIGRWLRADAKLTLLLAIGTAICGAAAVAAVSPLLKSKDEDTAVSVGLIALTGTVFAAAYTLLQPWLPLDAATYGIWSGLTLHEIAHVAMAAAPAGPDAIADGLLAKLCRVALLIPLCFAIGGISKLQLRRKPPGTPDLGDTPSSATVANAADSRVAFPFPWFLVGFLATSLFGSYALPHLVPEPAVYLRGLSTLTTLMLGMAMAGLGLNVSLRDFRDRALRPFAAMLAASILLSLFTYLTLM